MATATIARENARPIEEVALRRIPLATLIAAVVGTAANVVLFIIGQATGAIGRIRRPVTVFRVVSLVILVLSFASPFTIPGVGGGFIFFLELMHIAAAAAIVWSLTTLARR